ncbi:MAG: chorismate mutase [Gemmataceae bacterium]|nr:chorismate mutase [Gemmataceae bacterium]
MSPGVRRLVPGVLWFGLLAAWPGVCGCRAEPPPGPTAQVSATPDLTTVSRVLAVMNDRLAVMHDVARWKWAEGRPIADPARETQLLDRVAARGREKGLDPTFVRTLFAAQIEASKQLQQADFGRWKTSPPPAAAVPPLAVLRERIDAIDHQLLDSLTAAEHTLTDPLVRGQIPGLADTILTGDGVDPSVRATTIGPLLGR